MYLSSATNRITVTWGNYGKVSPLCPSPTALCAPCPSHIDPIHPAFSTLMLQPLCPQSYSVALYLVRQLTSSDLLQRLKTIGVKHPELCKALGEQLGPQGLAVPGGTCSVPGCAAPVVCARVAEGLGAKTQCQPAVRVLDLDVGVSGSGL